MGQGLWRVAADAAPADRATSDKGSYVEILGDWVLGLLEDRAGNIWAGTYEGLNKLTKARMIAVPSMRTASAIDLTPDGHVWVGTAESLVRFAPDRDRWQAVEQIRVSGLRALHVNERGTVWVATPGGLFQVSGGRLVSVCSSDRDDSLGHITSITSDSHGGVWLYSRGLGPFRWNNGRLQALPWPPDFDAVPAVSAYTDSHGWVWFTSGHRGVRVIVPGRQEVLTTYTAKDGLDEDDYGLLYEDSHANIWLGGRGVLSRFRDGRFQTVTGAHGFPEEIIRSIIEDDRGTLWLGTGSGIVRMEPSEFDRAIDRRGYQIRYSLYDVADGVYGLPVFHGSRNAVKTADGRLWFVTAKGLTIVDPKLVNAAPPPARVSIEAVIADGRRQTVGDSVVLPSRTDTIDIKYSALDLTAPQKIRFRYFLESFDKTWLDGNSEHVARYTNLPAGQYRFRVTADTGERSAAPLEAALPFTIAPVFYRTTWFYAVLSLTLAAALWTAWRVRSWQIHQRYAAIVDERARLGRTIHDTLLQSLIGIAWQCDVIASDVEAAAPGLGARLVQMRDLVERHVREVRHSIWELRSPTLERRDLAAALEELAEAAASDSNVELVFEITGPPRRSDDAVEEQLLRIGQEAVFNAIRHARPTRIRVELAYLPDAIRLAVSDDGQGFNAEVAQQTPSGHFGLSFMKERADNVGGTLTIGSQPGRGTDVEAIIPTTTH
jgi:signal transduction histidine kinase/ligand-binding sensor domain-containing protein